METIVKKYVGQTKMFHRVGTQHVYPINDCTGEAVCQLNWAYEKLSEPDFKCVNGKTMHELANREIEKQENKLIKYLCITA